MKPDKTYGISVGDLNVPSTGKADASEGIQQALDSDASLVYIPSGVYRIDEGLRIPGNTQLRLHPEAHVFFGDGAGKCSSDFLLSNANPEHGDTNIAVSGGIWDGNNRNNPRGREGDPDAYTGTMINMKNVTGLELSDMRMKDSTAYFTRLTRVKRFRVENIRFQITHQTRNQDGIHCAGNCEDGDIHDIFAHGLNTTEDDLVALNADDALLRSELLGAEAGSIRNIRISNLQADDCHSFVRMASIWAEISDIDIRGVRGGCRNMALNADGLRYCRVPLFNADDSRYLDGVGLLKNVRFANAQVHKTGAGNKPLFCLESRMENVHFVNIRRDLALDACPESTLLALKNVKQYLVKAEYRRGGAIKNENLRIWPVAGTGEKYVKEMAQGCISSFEVTSSDHIVDMWISRPEMHDLPPANNMVGLSID